MSRVVVLHMFMLLPNSFSKVCVISFSWFSVYHILLNFIVNNMLCDIQCVLGCFALIELKLSTKWTQIYSMSSFGLLFSCMKRHQDQDNLQKKTFNWRISYIFRWWIHDHHSRKHGGRQADGQAEHWNSNWKLISETEALCRDWACHRLVKAQSPPLVILCLHNS